MSEKGKLYRASISDDDVIATTDADITAGGSSFSFLERERVISTAKDGRSVAGERTRKDNN